MIETKKPAATLLEGELVTDPEKVRALYQAGNFEYQMYIKGSPALQKLCHTASQRDYIILLLSQGQQVVVGPPQTKNPAQ